MYIYKNYEISNKQNNTIKWCKLTHQKDGEQFIHIDPLCSYQFLHNMAKKSERKHKQTQKQYKTAV